GNRRGNIIVTLMVHEKECLVRVDDNGTGKAAKGVGRGLVLVEGLTQQLGGSFGLEISTAGTRGSICFPFSRNSQW
ncbi:MAG: hypothetical protein WBX25_34405, partial [Rhodomicrobium sp.]